MQFRILQDTENILAGVGCVDFIFFMSYVHETSNHAYGQQVNYFC